MNEKILIVDDDPEILSMLGEMLKSHKYRVVTAGDGVEGFRKAAEENPDLIFLDIVMPKRDGFKMLSDLKREDATSSIPVIVLSGKGETSSLMEGIDGGAIDYIIKPYTVEKILKYVKKYIG